MGDLSGGFEDLSKRMGVLEDDVEEFHGDFDSEVRDTSKRFKKTSENFEELQEKVNDFNEKAKANFAIAEEALIKLNYFCNELDSRHTTEGIINRCCFDDME